MGTHECVDRGEREPKAPGRTRGGVGHGCLIWQVPSQRAGQAARVHPCPKGAAGPPDVQTAGTLLGESLANSRLAHIALEHITLNAAHKGAAHRTYEGVAYEGRGGKATKVLRYARPPHDDSALSKL